MSGNTETAVVLPELVDEPLTAEIGAEEPSRRPSRLVQTWRAAGSAVEWLLGAIALVLGLSLLASYPIVQLLSLGYLLEVAGRIARTGRLRSGLIGYRKAARVGSVVLGVWLLLWPLRLVSSLAASARLIAPGSRADRGWNAALVVLTVLVVVHILGAIWRGGKLRHFVWPAPLRLVREIWRGGAYARARDAVCDFIAALRLPYYFWLGLRGFLGGLAWLIVPITLLGAGRRAPPLGFVGGLLLVVVLLYLPFLQTRFAAENRFKALFELRGVRAWFRRAPLLFWLALLVTLAFALPLYLLKIEIIPREAAWLPSLVFVAFTLPARMLTGWACGFALHREQNRHWFWRLTARLGMLPVAAIYALIVYFTQFTSWHGIYSLYEQHAFLVPVPFLGL